MTHLYGLSEKKKFSIASMQEWNFFCFSSVCKPINILMYQNFENPKFVATKLTNSNS
jgi:hypothetical protein